MTRSLEPILAALLLSIAPVLAAAQNGGGADAVSLNVYIASNALPDGG